MVASALPSLSLPLPASAQSADRTAPLADAASGRFGAFRLIHLLGQGGMAEVWRAERETGDPTRTPVALKRILPMLTREPMVARMFADEARLALRLRHPHIVRALEAGTVGDDPFIVLELIDGVDLRSITRAATGPLPIGFALHVARALADALAYAHRLRDEHGRWLGIVHRDVSPSNVMIGCDGAVKLLDFGVAKAVAGARAEATRFGVLKGKPGYMAPELLDGAPYDDRADLFALGVVLWELLAGRRLFSAVDEDELLALNRAGRVVPPSQHRSEVPASVDALVLQALARDPARRFLHSEDLEAVLAQACAAHPWSRPDTRALLRQARLPEPPPLPEPPMPAPPAAASTATELPTRAYGDHDDESSWFTSGVAALVRGGLGLPPGATVPALPPLPEPARGRRRWPRAVVAGVALGLLAMGLLVSRAPAPSRHAATARAAAPARAPSRSASPGLLSPLVIASAPEASRLRARADGVSARADLAPAPVESAPLHAAGAPTHAAAAPAHRVASTHRAAAPAHHAAPGHRAHGLRRAAPATAAPADSSARAPLDFGQLVDPLAVDGASP